MPETPWDHPKAREEETKHAQSLSVARVQHTHMGIVIAVGQAAGSFRLSPTCTESVVRNPRNPKTAPGCFERGESLLGEGNIVGQRSSVQFCPPLRDRASQSSVWSLEPRGKGPGSVVV